MTTISITIPDSLRATVHDIVEREGMSFEQFILLAMTEKASAMAFEQFILLAMTEKASAMATEAYLEARANRGSREKFLAAMAKVEGVDLPEE